MGESPNLARKIRELLRIGAEGSNEEKMRFPGTKLVK
jgi:hypothetical protein